MILKLNDIGKIKEAKIELNGITVIAGENNTGKSTVGKALFIIFNSFYKIDKQIDKEIISEISNILMREYFVDGRIILSEVEEFIKDILKNKDLYKEDLNLLKSELINFLSTIDTNFEENISKETIENVKEKIFRYILLTKDDILKKVLSKNLEVEFNRQINNIYLDTTGFIELNIKDINMKIEIENNEVIEISEEFNLNTEVIYIDDPFILDEIYFLPIYTMSSNYRNHRSHLRLKLNKPEENSYVKDTINELLILNKIENVLSKLNSICDGEVIKSKRATGYVKKDSEKVLNIKNTSTGLKTFIIIKTLLINGNLDENGTIILDEPEIHLHPEWQIMLAEIIVLLQKEFNMHILLNTHSPYFLRAIQVYSAKHNIANKCKYYMAENVNENQSIIIDVTTNIDEIYKKLAKPFETLEIERYGND